jgi:diketogulonate reductase-like aldo/keto reductase
MQAGYRHIDCAQIYGNEKEVISSIGFPQIDFPQIYSLASQAKRSLSRITNTTQLRLVLQIGFALKKVFEDGIISREDLFITSKLWSV